MNRKYLGTEDPETGELIPSSGRKGMKKKDGSAPASNQSYGQDASTRKGIYIVRVFSSYGSSPISATIS